MIPVKYNVRNLRVRWKTTLMTALAIGLLVCASVFVFGLVDGLKRALVVSSDELKLLVMRKGSQTELSSGIQGPTARELAETIDGVAKDSKGRTMASPEALWILAKPRRGDTVPVNVSVRGLTDIGRSLRPDFRIVAGRDLAPGRNEAIASRSIAERFQDTGIDEKLKIGGAEFTIVGLFEAGGSLAESEVWTDVRDLQSARKVPDVVNSVVLRARDAPSKQAIIRRIEEDPQFNLKAVDEKEYYAEQLKSISTIQQVGYGLAIFLSIGAMFGAANTMYAAVASRSREIGTLRALGFSRRSILTCFIFESIVLCLMGGLVGCLGTLPFNGVSSGTSSQMTFSEMTFSFNFGPRVLLEGALMALVMGLVGGLFPAVRAVRMNIISALREV